MNPEVKVKWIAALRSGKYTQGRGYLKYEDANGTLRYCCLGVLCEVATKEGLFLEVDSIRNYSDHLALFGFNGNRSTLPASVSAWADVTQYGDVPDSNWRGDNLAVLNDNGIQFDEIANIIEQHF